VLDSPSGSSWFKDFWDILKSRASIRPMIATGFVSGLAIFLPSSLLERMGASGWIKDHWPWILIIFSFCTAMLLIHAIEAMAKPIIETHKVKKRLACLTDDERKILLRFRASDANLSTLMMWPHENGIGTLIEDNILFLASPSLSDGATAFGLSRPIRKYLWKHPKAVI
jgi:superinfection exclusion protein B